MVIPTGFETVTLRFGICCSILLIYWTTAETYPFASASLIPARTADVAVILFCFSVPGQTRDGFQAGFPASLASLAVICAAPGDPGRRQEALVSGRRKSGFSELHPIGNAIGDRLVVEIVGGMVEPRGIAVADEHE